MLFRAPKLNNLELGILNGILAAREKLKHRIAAPQRWLGVLRRNTFARAIRGSNSIEGYNVTADDAIAAAQGEAPVEAERAAWLAVTGYRSAMNYVLQLAADPHFSYNEGFLRSLHFMMLHYDLPKHPGCWRPGAIYVRDDERREVVYEGPDADLVPRLAADLIADLNSDRGGPVLVRAAMAHLNLVMIHPFSDGNGRMARCLQTLVLGREGILEPQFSSIEEYLGGNTRAYYDVLAAVGRGRWNPGNDARRWIRFCLTAHHRQAETLLRRTNEISRLWDELEELVRRFQLPERMQFALADAAMGLRVRNASYRPAAEISENLASRDLTLLVRRGLLVADGERRGRVYVASEDLKRIRQKTLEPRKAKAPVYDD